MDSILPIIPMSDLQRRAKQALAEVKDFAVIQSHGHDRAFVLHPTLGRILMESGMLDALRKRALTDATAKDDRTAEQLKGLIGGVLKELSKK